jgi:hypothetical protein
MVPPLRSSGTSPAAATSARLRSGDTHNRNLDPVIASNDVRGRAHFVLPIIPLASQLMLYSSFPPIGGCSPFRTRSFPDWS